MNEVSFHKMRTALTQIVNILAKSASKCSLNSEEVFTKKREGLRIKEFCVVILHVKSQISQLD